jgi:2'-5' RNA ligase
MSADRANGPVVRVFYALVPPVPLQQTLGHLARALALRVHGRPVPAENIHLTLAFVGAWPASGLDTLLDVGARVPGRGAEVTLDTLGGFRRAGVAWIGASTPPVALTALAALLERALCACGVAVDARPFHPHLTLARHCHGPFAPVRTGPFEWHVDAVTLMQSDTRPEGSRYTPIARWPLPSD